MITSNVKQEELLNALKFARASLVRLLMDSASDDLTIDESRAWAEKDSTVSVVDAAIAKATWEQQ